MAATRQAPAFQIFQDPISSASALPPQHKPKPQLQPSAMPLQPLHNAPNLASASVPHPQQVSPQKTRAVSPPKNHFPDLGYVSIPPPQQPHFPTDSPVKRAHHPPRHYRPEPLPQLPLFTTFNSNFDAFEQENYYPPSSAHDNADFPEPSYVRKNNIKRSYSDVAPMNDRPFKKSRSEDETTAHLPEPDEMPHIEDDGNKPSYSYAQMIGMAILRAPNRRLTLAQIYDWISTTFSFYREDSKQGWHNSIRHNLSLNKAFQKMERPKGDAGKGSYWVIQPGMEGTFLKDKNRKGGSNLANITVHANIMRPDVQSASQPLPEPLAPSPFISKAIMVDERPQTAPALPELSSDATLPASDPALNEDEVPEFDTSCLPPPQSSSPDAINSSPPVAINTHRRSGSSPTSRPRRSSIMRHKRNAATMDDSGYFSSIESSILRPKNKSAVVLTSELDNNQPRKKQRFGRAEDAIQQMRSSSHDITPSHHRVRSVNFALDPQSSPLNPTPPSRHDPTTPAVFKKPMRPPPSVSPNTQLLLHRRAMQDFTNSPVKSYGLFPQPSLDPSLLEAWSPLKWPAATAHLAGEEFEIFSDPAVGMTPGFGSSPLKSAKRPSLARASTTANVLSDALSHVSAKLNSKTPTKAPTSHALLKPSPTLVLNGSPLKGRFTAGSIVGDENHDDMFDWEQFENENEDSDENLDLTKGFGKIGAPAPAAEKAQAGQLLTQPAKRPAMPRSFTSRF